MSRVKIAHLSDPHFGTIHEGVQEGLLESLNTLRPDLVLVSGDITQRARRNQFEAARRFKNSIHPIPFFAVPGNHDIPLFNLLARLFRPYRGFHTYFQSKRETDIRLGDVRVLGLNSTSKWRHIQGSLDIDRIREKFLSDWDTAKVRIAMVHHPLECAKGIDDKNRLKNREATVKLFQEAKIDLILSGHVHDPYVSVEHSLVLSVAGTCLSWRTRKNAPNSFHLIEIETEPRKIMITRLDMNDQKCFMPRADGLRSFEQVSGEWKAVD